MSLHAGSHSLQKSRTPSGPKYTRLKSSFSHSMPRVSNTMFSSRNLALAYKSPRCVNASNISRTISTFSCDIARAVSPAPRGGVSGLLRVERQRRRQIAECVDLLLPFCELLLG